MTVVYDSNGFFINNPAEKVLNLLNKVEYCIELKDYIAAEVTIHKLSKISHLMDSDSFDRYENFQHIIDIESYFE